MVGLRSVRIPAPQNRILKMFPESCGRAQDALVDEVNEREVLEKIVLKNKTKNVDTS